jgi:hypothetical protein
MKYTTSISKFFARYYTKIRLSAGLMMCAYLGTSAIPAGTVRFHGLSTPKHVEKVATFSLVSNKTIFFITPAHHASVLVSNVIKGGKNHPS